MADDDHTPADPSPEATRERLIGAAGEVFSRHGFKAGTVREICALAGANVAAINYHFGGKDGLYAATLRDLFRRAHERHPVDAGLPERPTAEDRLRAFVRSFVRRLLDDEASARGEVLISREMAEPTAAFTGLIDREMRPKVDVLRAIVRDLVGDAGLGERGDETVDRCCASVIAQVVFHHHARRAVEAIFPHQSFDEPGIDALADHVTTFTLHGLAGYRDGPEVLAATGHRRLTTDPTP